VEDQELILNIKYLCTNNHTRAEGLMGKPKLKDDECAFFNFPYSDFLSFWNKNVDFDIYVGFADENFRILCFKTLLAHQETPIQSCGMAKYVIEVSHDNKDFEKIIQSNYFKIEGNNIILKRISN
jgi:uncharacterized membrane protein (UPF0127 family)